MTLNSMFTLRFVMWRWKEATVVVVDCSSVQHVSATVVSEYVLITLSLLDFLPEAKKI